MGAMVVGLPIPGVCSFTRHRLPSESSGSGLQEKKWKQRSIDLLFIPFQGRSIDRMTKQECTSFRKGTYSINQCVKEKMLVAQLCLTLCESRDCSLPDLSVHGISQARRLEWVVIPFSRGSSQLGDRTLIFHTAGRFFTVRATRETPVTVSVQFSSVAQSCPTLCGHESQHARPPCPSPTPRVYSISCPSSR